MKLTSEALRELYQRETARSARLRDSECLPAEMLTGAAAGELGEAERGVVADHLTVCSSCANEYREIRSLKSWAESASESLADSTTQVETGRVLRLPDRHLPVQPPPVAGSRLFAVWVPLALAAMFLLVAVLLGAQLISQRRENDRLVAQVNEKELAGAEARRRAEEAEAARRAAQEELAKRAAEQPPAQRTPETGPPSQPGRQVDQPLVNVPIFELEPRGSTRGTGTDVVTLEAASDTRLITLILHVNGELSPDTYSLEVLDQAGRPVWASRGLRQNRYKNFTVALPRRTFPAGDYRLKLYSLRDGRREIVEEYAMRLQYR